MITSSVPLLASSDPRVVDAVLAACSSQGITAEVARDPVSVRRWWRSARLVLVGADMAPVVAGLGLPVRTGVHLVGHRRDDLVGWSVPLDASVIVLPEHAGLLGSVLEVRSDHAGGRGQLVRVLGGSGGLGVSTLVAGLAQVAAARRLAVVAVELDPCGGGLDLLFGAETAPGWRWGDLRAAAGHVEGLSGRLPRASGVDVLAHGHASFPVSRSTPRRGEGAPGGLVGGAVGGVVAGSAPAGPPGAEAVRAVTAALTRSHELVVVDCGHEPPSVGDQWATTRTLLVAAASTRGVVAARARLAASGVMDAGLVVRQGAGRPVDAGTVATALDLPLVGVVHDDRRVVSGEAVGMPPARGRGRFHRDAAAILDLVRAEVAAGEAVA